MAEYLSADDAAARHQAYPDLSADLRSHDFQRRRVRSSLRHVRHGETVLEVGCNTGYARQYCPQASEMHGVDVNEAHVEEARKVLTSAQVARAESLPFPSRSFDVVNVAGVLEQCFDPEGVMREAGRVARRAVVGNTVHESGTWGKHRTERHDWQCRSFSEQEIRRVLGYAGRVSILGTVDINQPPEPQCWFFVVDVNVTTYAAAGEQR